MTVHIRHLREGDFSYALIDGVYSQAALDHLRHSLLEGSSFDDDAVVVDVASLTTDTCPAVERLVAVALELETQHRWLGVVSSATGPALLGDHVYATCTAAVDAGRRYFRLVTGQRPWHPTLNALRTLAGLAVTGVSVATAVGRSCLRAARSA
jgi:hypothetical protein